MDSRTLKLMNNIDAYLEHPPPGVPDQLVEQITNTKEMLSAPMFSGESPGERESREVAEATMPPDVSDEYNGVTDNNNVGVLGQL